MYNVIHNKLIVDDHYQYTSQESCLVFCCIYWNSYNIIQVVCINTVICMLCKAYIMYKYNSHCVREWRVVANQRRSNVWGWSTGRKLWEGRRYTYAFTYCRDWTHVVVLYILNVTVLYVYILIIIIFVRVCVIKYSKAKAFFILISLFTSNQPPRGREVNLIRYRTLTQVSWLTLAPGKASGHKWISEICMASRWKVT